MRWIFFLAGLILSSIPVNAAIAQQKLEIMAVFTGENRDQGFGRGISGGDYNADGYSDILISAGNWNGGTGRVWLFTGSPEMDTIPDLVLQGEKQGNAFDFSPATLLDFNGDIIQDFAIPSPGYESHLGKVDVFYGGQKLTSTPDHTIIGFTPGKGFGYITKDLGDINGDGFSDLGMTAINGLYGDPTEAYIFLGGNLPQITAFWSLRNAGPFRTEIFKAGDVNGDGYDDVLIASEDTPARLYFGAAEMDTIPDLLLYEAFTIAGGGDLNADGYDDIIINFSKGGPEGTHVLFGSTAMDTTSDLILLNTKSRLIHARDISHGDINGDCYPDLIAGSLISFGTGAVYVYTGGPNMDGLPEVAMWGSNFGTPPGFGSYVCGAGDVNGDGADDILASDTEYLDKGIVYLFAGDKNLPITGVRLDSNNPIPVDLLLISSYPNPFNQSTNIYYEFTGNNPQWVALKIMNSLGHEVKHFTRKQQVAGRYAITWNGTDDAGTEVASGVYFCQIQVGHRIAFHKIILLK